MKDPFEFISKDYLPWMKGLISVDLTSKGYSQSKISTMIGVTQPSVNYYLKRKRGAYVARLEMMGLTPEAIETQEKRLIGSLDRGTNDGMAGMIMTVMDTLASGELCTYHKKVYRLPEDCDVCTKIWGLGSPSNKAGVLLQLDRAVAVLESSEAFPQLIPQVGSNFALAPPGATSPREVAGITGRISRLKGRARASQPAEFGGSGHLASVLLKVREKYPEVCCSINVKFDGEVQRAASFLGWNVLHAADNGSGGGEAGVLESIGSVVKGTRVPPDAVVHEGGLGLEAATYIFGRSAEEVVRKALDLGCQYGAKSPVRRE